MGRPKKTLRPMPVNVSLDEDVDAQMRLHLFSEVEGRIPHGAISALMNKLLRDHFKLKKRLALKLKKIEVRNAGIDDQLSQMIAEGAASQKGGPTDGA